MYKRRNGWEEWMGRGGAEPGDQNSRRVRSYLIVTNIRDGGRENTNG